jgi:hypothetical protein
MLGEHEGKHERLSKDSWFSNQDSNPEPPGYNPAVRPRRSIFRCKVVAYSTQHVANGKKIVYMAD